MTTPESSGMRTLLLHMRQHFEAMTLKLDAFVEHQVQVESWFKGECLALATILQKIGVVDSVEREVRMAAGRVDLAISVAGRRHLIELKHWLVGRQKGSDYSCQFYFADKSTGCWGDVVKLSTISDAGSAWLWLFMTRNPGSEDWQRGLTKFNERFAPLQLRGASDPDHYPSSYFLGVASVCPAVPNP